MASSFQQRRLRITIKLVAGAFSKDGNPDTVVLEDFRTRVNISQPGGYEFASLRASIYGVSKDTMDRLTFINFTNLDIHRNTIQVEATDANGLFTTIYLGEITEAYAEYSGAPDVPFMIEAVSGLVGSLSVSPAVNYPGPQKVVTMLTQLANELNLSLENNGVDNILTDQYLTGSPMQKVQRIAANARIQYWYVPEQGVLAIAPMKKPRNSTPVLYSPETGLVGWPKLLYNGIQFRALFVPQVFQGCRVKVESSVPACNGDWYIASMSHSLDASVPGGAWFSDFVATSTGELIATL